MIVDPFLVRASNDPVHHRDRAHAEPFHVAPRPPRQSGRPRAHRPARRTIASARLPLGSQPERCRPPAYSPGGYPARRRRPWPPGSPESLSWPSWLSRLRACSRNMLSPFSCPALPYSHTGWPRAKGLSEQAPDVRALPLGKGPLPGRLQPNMNTLAGPLCGPAILRARSRPASKRDSRNILGSGHLALRSSRASALVQQDDIGPG